MGSIQPDLTQLSRRASWNESRPGSGRFGRQEAGLRGSLDRAFFIVNIVLIVAACGTFIYFRWGDLGNHDVRGIGFAAIDFISHSTLYTRAYIEKPPLAFLMYLPLGVLPALSGPTIYFVIVIAIESLLLRWLLRLLKFDKAACLGGVALFLAATLFKHELDYVSLSHLTNLLILGACIAAVTGSVQGIIVSAVLIAASFYIRQNNVFFACYPLLLARLAQPRPLAVYLISMMVSFFVLFGMFCVISDVRLFLYTTFIYPFMYPTMAIGHPPSPRSHILIYFGKQSLPPLLLFFSLWFISTMTRVRAPVNGRTMMLLFAIAFMIMVLPNKTYPHYQGYLLIWLGLLGAWAVHILASPFLDRQHRWPLHLAAGCVSAFISATAYKEITLRSELMPARARLDTLLLETRKALDRQPGTPTLQVFDPIYREHEAYDGLLLTMTGATPATPLIFTPFFAEWFSSALPPAFRDQWGLLARAIPNVVVLINVRQGDDLVENVGANFLGAARKFLIDHGYRTRVIATGAVIAEKP